jgi:hypothetical protein
VNSISTVNLKSRGLSLTQWENWCNKKRLPS